MKFNFPYFTVDVYDLTVHVIFDKNWHQICKDLYKELEPSLEAPELGRAATVQLKGKLFMFFPLNTPDRDIYHECMHICMLIGNGVELEFGLSHMEAFAYLLEYIIYATMKLKKESHKRKVKDAPAKGKIKKSVIKKSVRKVIKKRK